MGTAAFDFELWLSALPFLLAAATLTWLVSLPLRNVAIVQSIWSLMLFVAGVIYALGSDPRAPRLDFVLWLLVIWAARLSMHITARNLGLGEDRRYQEIRARNEPRFALKSLYRVFWLQAIFAWFVSLPLLGAFASLAPVGWLDWLGIGLWVFGFGIEAIADGQLARFRKDPAHAGQLMDRGLWRYTRHPNYFGEFCLWWGFGCIAVAAGAWWALAGPALLSFLLLRASGNRRPRDVDYVLKTNAFFPGRPRS
jgi:steroid 5-alpha reductase family enzyme